MTSADDPQSTTWLRRLARMLSLGLALAAAVSWLRPVNVPGANFMPYGCGSPGMPTQGELSKLMCSDTLTGDRLGALALIVGAVLVLLVGEVALTRRPARGRAAAVWTAVLVAIPVLTFGVFGLLRPLVVSGANGQIVGCGSPVAPELNPLVRGQCGNLPESERTLYGAIVLGGVLAPLAAAYVTGARLPKRPGADETSVETGPDRNREQLDSESGLGHL